MTGVDWDTVKGGDPDPTWGCDATTGEPDRWRCTRDLGHDGPHVAGDGDTVVAVWT